tara:strand:+ start:298 stop:741 length:444 start_codon:yes stop_codon:yes gene_type:complete
MSRKKWIPRSGERVIIPKGTPVWTSHPAQAEIQRSGEWEKLRRRLGGGRMSRGGWFAPTEEEKRKVRRQKKRAARRYQEGDYKAKKTYEVTVEAVEGGYRRGTRGSSARNTWIGWSAGKKVKWTRLENVKEVPSDVEQLADVGKDWT